MFVNDVLDFRCNRGSIITKIGKFLVGSTELFIKV